MIIQVETYLWNDLVDKKALINIYNGECMYIWDLELYWKEFAFDIISELKDITILQNEKYLLNFIKNNYKILIENEQLNIDIQDYPMLVDYVTIEKWKELGNEIIIS